MLFRYFRKSVVLCIALKYSSNYIKRNPFHTVATTLQVPMEKSSKIGTACGSNNSDAVHKEIHGTEEATPEVSTRGRSETDAPSGSDNGGPVYKTYDSEDAIDIAEDMVGEADLAGKRMVEIDIEIIRQLLLRADEGWEKGYLTPEWYQWKRKECEKGRQWRIEMGWSPLPEPFKFQPGSDPLRPAKGF